MRRDCPDTLRSPLLSRRALCLPAFRSPARPRETRAAAAKALVTSEPDPSPPASRRCPPKSAKSPTSGPPPAHTSRPTASGIRHASTFHHLAAEPRAPACPSAASPEIPLRAVSPSEILGHRRDQPLRKLPRHAIQCRVAFLKETLHIG